MPRPRTLYEILIAAVPRECLEQILQEIFFEASQIRRMTRKDLESHFIIRDSPQLRQMLIDYLEHELIVE